MFLDNDDTGATIILVIRTISRVAFTFLLLSLYHIWRTFGSPLLKLRTQKFVIIYGILFTLSTVVTVAEYFISTSWWSILSMTLNTVLWLALACYMYTQTRGISKKSEPHRFREYSLAMDNLILSMKK